MKKRNRRKQKKSDRRRLYAAVGATVLIAAAGSTMIYMSLPQTRVGRKLDQALAYMTALDYVQAEEAYTEALSIDEGSVRAYRGLADDYVAQGRIDEAEEILQKGYEVTGSEALLQNYCATVLNGVVAQLNEGLAGLAELERCLDVLEADPDNDDALSLLQTGIARILAGEESCRVLLDEKDGSGSFETYQALAGRLLDLAESDPQTYAEAAVAAAVPASSQLYLSLTHRDAYRELLERAQALGSEDAAELLACLEKQEEISGYFAPMFTSFENGDFEAARDFIVTDRYEQIRDAFISGTMEYWEGSTYVPVTKEAVVFSRGETGWTFSYVENDQLVNPTGTIRVLGQKMEDLGVQRSGIQYAPAYEAGHYYPHTEYEIVYWNTMVSGIATDNTNVVSRMNYRFSKKIYRETDSEAEMIYDWGGPNEKRETE
ncbi:MAG: tetratricopeptide repeat protein [Eubacteriales bacterium]|nr:tetratricopeptide repeat protein [Eubacteriales bacterium]